MKIAVIDYKMSNMFSIRNAINLLGFNCRVTSDPKTILSSQGVVLPGVGSFPEAMRQLREMGLIKVIKEFIDSGKPFMGICLGMQLLFSKSEEFDECEGLGLIDGSVIGFANYNLSVSVPHVGWNTIINQNIKGHNYSITPPNFKLVEDYYYFVHSFFVKPDNKDIIFTTTRYGDLEFCSSILNRNVFACQFHPEKSGIKGVRIFHDFFKGENNEL